MNTAKQIAAARRAERAEYNAILEAAELAMIEGLRPLGKRHGEAVTAILNKETPENRAEYNATQKEYSIAIYRAKRKFSRAVREARVDLDRALDLL